MLARCNMDLCDRGHLLTSRASLFTSCLFVASSVPFPDAGVSSICLPDDRSGGGDWPRSGPSGIV
jgi:hypothetical protein